VVFLVITRYTLLFDDWRGYPYHGFALVWVANVYMSVFGFYLRLDIREERPHRRRGRVRKQALSAVVESPP
jgi:hypothetical protein